MSPNSQRLPTAIAARRQQIVARRARWRRWRAGSLAGVAIAPTPYDAAIVEVLVALRSLPDAPVYSAAAVGAAINAALKSIRK